MLASMSQGIAIFDINERLVKYNDKFKSLYPSYVQCGALQLGMTYENFVRYGVENKLVCVDKNSAEQHIQKRLKEFPNPEQSFDVLRKNETWIRCSNKKTNAGRTLCLREDITASKLAEK